MSLENEAAVPSVHLGSHLSLILFKETVCIFSDVRDFQGNFEYTIHNFLLYVPASECSPCIRQGATVFSNCFISLLNNEIVLFNYDQ